MRAGLVTGAASGIGRRAAGEETVRLITDAGGDATYVACDVAVAEQCQALVAATLAAYGRLDFAHNNAGIDRSALIVDTDDADFERILRVNLWGVWSGMKAQIPAMIEGGGGAIVNTSSLAGVIGAPTLGAYVASKHAVLGLVRSAAAAFGPAGVRVNAVAPGPVATEALLDRMAARAAATEHSPEQALAAAAGATALGRIATTDDVVGALAFLTSDLAGGITGQLLPVDGGLL